MNWQELLAKAKDLGFTFEEQTWVPDDYWEDEDGKKHAYTKPETQLKVIFPLDYPHPAQWMNIDDISALQYQINEYMNREETAKATQKHNEELREGMSKFKDKFKDLLKA